MPLIISCPSCGNQGELPDAVPPGVTLTCRQCGARFAPGLAPVARPGAVPPPQLAGDPSAVWVGPGPGPGLPMPQPFPMPAPPNLIPLAPAAAGGRVTTTIAPEDAAAHLRWLQDETKRFNAYVDRQLGLLQSMRDQLTGFEAKVRTDALTREQGLNRDRAVLDARVVEVAKREAELAKREAELTATMAQHGEHLTSELGQLMATEREQLSQRADELARAEEAVQRRLAEVEELEQTTRDELAAKEAAVERRQQAVAEAERTVRARIPVKGGPAFFVSPPAPPPPPADRAGA